MQVESLLHSIVLAVRVMEVRVDASNIDNFSWVVLKSNINDGLEHALNFL